MPDKTPYQFLDSDQGYRKLIDDHDTFLFDCDGVLWSGDDLIPHAVDVLSSLRKEGKELIFVTNNATKSRRAYKAKFDQLGIRASEDEIFSSAYGSAVYLKRVLNFPADRKVYVIGMEGIEEELDAEGILHCGGTDEADRVMLPPLDFSSLQDPSAIDPKVGAVLCGFDMHVSYVKLAKAFRHLTREGAEGDVGAGAEGGGCHFILTNDDSTFPAKGGFWPGAGSLSAPLLFSTGRKPTIVGKPHQPMLDCILAKKKFDPSRAIFFGDRLDTDIAFANAGSLPSAMVLTGVHSLRDAQQGDIKHPVTGDAVVPTYVLNSLGDLAQAFST